VTDDSRITTTISIADVLSLKLRALQAHATQVSVWQAVEGAHSYALSNGIAQPVPAAEFYVLARGAADGADTDLFGGL
jgi:N-acetyl-1-D-myo-inositol-2-amino-2-deoxy-alpha-D-glucopyranoside deacetylase